MALLCLKGLWWAKLRYEKKKAMIGGHWLSGYSLRCSGSAVSIFHLVTPLLFGRPLAPRLLLRLCFFQGQAPWGVFIGLFCWWIWWAHMVKIYQTITWFTFLPCIAEGLLYNLVLCLLSLGVFMGIPFYSIELACNFAFLICGILSPWLAPVLVLCLLLFAWFISQRNVSQTWLVWWAVTWWGF